VLILSRRESECVCLGDNIVLTIVAVGNDKIRIGVQAPPGVRILRTELEVSTLPFSPPPASNANAVENKVRAAPLRAVIAKSMTPPTDPTRKVA
jgi:carbon storage regulator